jgi:hypothetical protein
VLLMMLVGWLVLSVLTLPPAIALGRAARLQDRAARRSTSFVAEPALLGIRA